MSIQSVSRPPELWERGCQTDEIRNSFAIPTIASFVEKRQPLSIIDIGCGTGYITRGVAARTVRLEPQWRLLDHAADMLNFAQVQAFAAGNVQYFLHDLANCPKEIVPTSELGFLAYTLLDFSLNEQMAHNIASLISPSGNLILFMPDVLEDVVDAAKGAPLIMDEYLRGHCSLAKTDKFTAKNVLFEANRVEYVIWMFLETGMSLTKLDRFESSKQKTHYALEFKKTD